MLIELLCRFAKTLSFDEEKEITESLEIQSIVQGDSFDSEITRNSLLEDKYGKYEYSPIVFNLKDIQAFNSADDSHTCIRFYNGSSSNFKISYTQFKTVYESITGHTINKIENDRK